MRHFNFMATKTTKTVSETLTNDPFASTVEVKAVKKRTTKAVAETAAAAKPLATKAKTKVKTIEVDPFAEVAVAVSPAKKAVGKAQSATNKPKKEKKKNVDQTSVMAADEPKVELSPAFKALADVKLPELQRENRARLQMQTPTRLYFYWSVKENPWSMLKNVFGEKLGNYTLVVKLIDLTLGREEVSQCEAEGNWWFDVEPDRKYQAEIGFYATGRPYFRILHSNVIETPRRSPSPRAATEAKWTVSANKFAEVLDVAGFSRDAFDVAMAGDDMGLAEDASHRAFRSFIGGGEFGLDGISPEEIRYALLALAAGVSLDELKNRVSPALFAILQANAGDLTSGRAMNSLSEHFEIEESEFTEEEFGPAVFGASLVNFPKTLKTRTVSSKKPGIEFAPRYNPVSSHNLR
jgi:hypothetical protein